MPLITNAAMTPKTVVGVFGVGVGTGVNVAGTGNVSELLFNPPHHKHQHKQKHGISQEQHPCTENI